MTATAPGQRLDQPPIRWWSAFPDVVAFAIGCGVAWWRGWRTTDLIWSLWLSSLVVGYSSIVWTIVRDRRSASIFLVLFLLGFFTFHFGMFHFVHSLFLNIFFPVIGRGDDFPDVHTYIEVLRRYWVFLPATFLSERAIFHRPAATPGDAPGLDNADFIQPYKNVVRMHLLIFFFVAASFIHLEGVVVFAVVYAVYFFPWRLWPRAKAPLEPEAST